MPFFYLFFCDIIQIMKNKIIVMLFALFCMPAMAEYDEYGNAVPTVLTDKMPQYVDDTGIDWFKFSSGYYQLDESTKNHAAGLNPGDWRAFYRDETNVLGTSTCNEFFQDGLFTEAQIRGPHCWCKIIATTTDIHKKTPTKWVYRGEFRDTTECANLCAYRCSYNFLGDPDFRGEIFNK